MDEEEKQDRPEIKQVADFFASVEGFLKANTKDDEIACMVITNTANGHFWIHGMVDNRVWEDGMLHRAQTIQDGRMYHHIAANAVKVKDDLQTQALRAADVKGKPQ